MSKKVHATYTSSDVTGAFKVFQGSAPNGYIKRDALERALSVYGSDRLTSTQVQDLLSQIDFDDTGLFNYAEYVSMMMAD